VLRKRQASLNADREARLWAQLGVPRTTDMLALTAELDRTNASCKRRDNLRHVCGPLKTLQQSARGTWTRFYPYLPSLPSEILPVLRSFYQV
jgi:hypothetical protein